MLKLRFHVIAFTSSSSLPLPFLSSRVEKLISSFNSQYGCNYSAGGYTLSDEYVGPEDNNNINESQNERKKKGNEGAYPESIYWAQRLARLEGIFLDPVCFIIISLIFIIYFTLFILLFLHYFKFFF